MIVAAECNEQVCDCTWASLSGRGGSGAVRVLVGSQRQEEGVVVGTAAGVVPWCCEDGGLATPTRRHCRGVSDGKGGRWWWWVCHSIVGGMTSTRWWVRSAAAGVPWWHGIVGVALLRWHWRGGSGVWWLQWQVAGVPWHCQSEGIAMPVQRKHFLGVGSGDHAVAGRESGVVGMALLRWHWWAVGSSGARRRRGGRAATGLSGWWHCNGGGRATA